MSNYPKIEVWIYKQDTEEDIFCFAEVNHYLKVPPNPYTWDSDLDYYGYEEIEYTLVDSEGNQLNIEVDEDTDEYIKGKIRDWYEKEYDCD